MKALFTVLIIASALFFSCKKAEDLNFPLDLYNSKISVKSKLRVFTSNGEITNPDVVNSFTKRFSNFRLETDKLIDPNEKVTFISKDTLLIGRTKYLVKKESSEKSTENIFLFYSIPNSPISGDNFLFDILKYTAPKIEVPLAVYGTSYVTKDVYVARGNYRQLNFSLLSYYFHKNVSGGFRSSSSYTFNEFQENAISKLTYSDVYLNSDTLAVKEYILTTVVK